MNRLADQTGGHRNRREAGRQRGPLEPPGGAKQRPLERRDQCERQHDRDEHRGRSPHVAIGIDDVSEPERVDVEAVDAMDEAVDHQVGERDEQQHAPGRNREGA
jgi:hypothetical protein